MTPPTPLESHPGTLVQFASAILPTLRLPSGTYCFDRTWESSDLRGDSLRYTLMVALGCQRAARHGYAVPDGATELLGAVIARQSELTLGDHGLVLWVASRGADDRTEAALARIGDLTAQRTADLAGMEAAWLVIGAAAAVEASATGSEALLEQSLVMLDRRRANSSPLYLHTEQRRGRGLFPNFATQVYSLLALADVARITGDDTARNRAIALADHLVASRDEHAGWPWLFHAERGDVVERYEVYSVHQDAMAPMAFFALAEATGDQSYARAGAEGLPWCFGHNEAGFNFYDVSNNFAHRAIKRRGLADALGLYANTALAMLGTSRRVDPPGQRINTTCRPYHLGWIMEAWAGREANVVASTP